MLIDRWLSRGCIIAGFCDACDELIFVNTTISVGVKGQHKKLKVGRSDIIIRQEAFKNLSEFVNHNTPVIVYVCGFESIKSAQPLSKESIVKFSDQSIASIFIRNDDRTSCGWSGLFLPRVGRIIG